MVEFVMKALGVVLAIAVLGLWSSSKKRKQKKRINLLTVEAESFFKAKKHSESIGKYKEILNIELNIKNNKHWTAELAYKNMEEKAWPTLNRLKEIYEVQGTDFNLNEWKELSNELKSFSENKKMVRSDGYPRKAGKPIAKKLEEQLILLYEKL